ncbi:MAG: acetoin utilization protein AcuC [Kineosporiaceae bacterium]
MRGLRLAWDQAFTGYDFGRGHPMSPLRLDLTHALCAELGLLDGDVLVAGAVPADDDTLLTAHTPDYVDVVRAASAPSPSWPEDLPARLARHGLGTDDVPVFVGMHEASARIAAASRDVALAVWRGEARHGVNVAGGLHHAGADAASGFCVYNDLVVAIRAVLAEGARRVVYVDVDAHHGDGVERAFWDDPRVTTISIHESGLTLFPGTGAAADVGGPRAQGEAVNVALPAGTGDDGWLRAFHAVVPPLVRAIGPDLLVTQHGCDGHALDPLTNLALSVDAQRAAAVALHDLAHESAHGRWVAFGGGGYEVVDVVPRAWAHLVGIAAHAPVEAATPVPPAWRQQAEALTGRPGPELMGDGAALRWRDFHRGYDPSDALDRAVMATRRAVFPLHGLDPFYD